MRELQRVECCIKRSFKTLYKVLDSFLICIGEEIIQNNEAKTFRMKIQYRQPPGCHFDSCKFEHVKCTRVVLEDFEIKTAARITGHGM